MENLNPTGIITEVIILKDELTARETRFSDKREFKIQDIVLGVGHYRKAVKWTKGCLKHGSTCRAEILPNGKIRII